MVYNYTVPRGPIAAMYSSPGPCYALPRLVGNDNHDPRSVHLKYPAYSFGIYHRENKKEMGPGPCYFPNPKIYRDGQDGIPHYSLYGRPKDPSIFKTPGPGAYSPEQSGQSAYFRHPAYSFGLRSKHRKTDDTPAPNNYSLPGMIGRTIQSSKRSMPCYTLAGRQKIGSFAADLAKAPGPGTYAITDPNTYKDKAPLYSIQSRNIMPGDTTQKPGPGAHKSELVTLTKKAAPAFSFGICHSPYEAPVLFAVTDD